MASPGTWIGSNELAKKGAACLPVFEVVTMRISECLAILFLLGLAFWAENAQTERTPRSQSSKWHFKNECLTRPCNGVSQTYERQDLTQSWPLISPLHRPQEPQL